MVDNGDIIIGWWFVYCVESISVVIGFIDFIWYSFVVRRVLIN